MHTGNKSQGTNCQRCLLRSQNAAAKQEHFYTGGDPKPERKKMQDKLHTTLQPSERE